MPIPRYLAQTLASNVDYRKAIILLGPRQVGKTTLIKSLALSLDPAYLYINGDDPPVQTQLANASLAFLNAYLGNAKVIVIDEAQRIQNIGITLKLIIDNIPGRQLLVTGSSALELSDKMNEPLTGRKWEYPLFPISWKELCDYETMAKSLLRLQSLLVLGMYPEVLTQQGKEVERLNNLATSYLYKDLLNFQGIRKPELLAKILQALAWQIGSEVNFVEVGRTVQADKNTVNHYINLLEKAFIIYRLRPFNRNLRTEISSSRKIYFYDNGIRNAIIGNYTPIVSRNDVGGLWENFLISERMKLLRYNGFYGHTYFWRTTNQQEIDYIEEIDGKLYAYEFKWNPSAKSKFSKSFVEEYKPVETKTIHRDNFWEWLLTYPY
jgi:uncharacterized protein